MILGSVYGHHGHALCTLELLVPPVVHRLRCPCTNCTLYCTTAAVFSNTTIELHVSIFLCVPPNTKTNPLQWVTHHSTLPCFAQYLILYFCFTRFYQNIFCFQHLFQKFPFSTRSLFCARFCFFLHLQISLTTVGREWEKLLITIVTSHGRAISNNQQPEPK